MMASSLADLPAELLSRIASHLWYPRSALTESDGLYVDCGFCSLRLCCRSIEAKTQYTFGRAAFSAIVVTLHAKSLLRLLGISNDPRFGKWINKLAFSKTAHPEYDATNAVVGAEEVGRWHAYAGYGVIELPKEGTDGVYPNHGMSLRNRVRLGLQDCFASIMAQTPNLKELVIAPHFMASFWLDSPSRQEQLDQRAQREYRVAQEREADGDSMSGDDSDLDAFDGENEDYDSDGSEDPHQLETYVYPDYLFYVVARAALHQRLRLSVLFCFNSSAMSLRARTCVELAPALKHLQHLNISINASGAGKLQRRNGSALHSYDPTSQLVAKSFGTALSTFRELQSLRLSFDRYYWEDDRSSNIFQALRGFGDDRFPCLTFVDISFANFAGRELYNFFHNQKDLIQDLSLQCIALPSTEHWRPILQLMLEDMPALTKAFCDQLTGPGYGDTSQDHNQTEGWRGCCEFQSIRRQVILKELGYALEMFPNSVG